jgi:chromate transporter
MGVKPHQPGIATSAQRTVGLPTIAREWGRIGCIGFGGPPAHISLLRELCVKRRGWLSETEFEDGIAATNLLPGPASTQLAIYTAWRLRGAVGAIVGGVCFIVPGLVLILLLASLFLAGHPPLAVRGAAAGAGAAVAAVAVHAAWGLVPGSWKRAGSAKPARVRWICNAVAGALAAALVGPLLVLVMIGTGLLEVAIRTGHTASRTTRVAAPLPLAALPAAGGLLALSRVAFKVGALSYGGGFVIIPLMQHDAVHTYHWMSDAQFLNAVALG